MEIKKKKNRICAKERTTQNGKCSTSLHYLVLEQGLWIYRQAKLKTQKKKYQEIFKMTNGIG